MSKLWIEVNAPPYGYRIDRVDVYTTDCSLLDAPKVLYALNVLSVSDLKPCLPDPAPELVEATLDERLSKIEQKLGLTKWRTKECNWKKKP